MGWALIRGWVLIRGWALIRINTVSHDSAKHLLTLGRERRWVWGILVFDGTPPLFRIDFTFSGKPLIFSTILGLFYGWWRCRRFVTSANMVAILDFTKN